MATTGGTRSTRFPEAAGAICSGRNGPWAAPTQLIDSLLCCRLDENGQPVEFDFPGRHVAHAQSGTVPFKQQIEAVCNSIGGRKGDQEYTARPWR